MSPIEVVQQQVDAYNAHDLGRFAAMFSERVTVFRMPSATPSLDGRNALAAFYAAERFNRPTLHAAIVNRMAFGNKVVDHERIVGLGPEPVEAVAVYEVNDGLIERVWFFASNPS